MISKEGDRKRQRDENDKRKRGVQSLGEGEENGPCCLIGFLFYYETVLTLHTVCSLWINYTAMINTYRHTEALTHPETCMRLYVRTFKHVLKAKLLVSAAEHPCEPDHMVATVSHQKFATCRVNILRASLTCRVSGEWWQYRKRQQLFG